ncbi:hypothetical protein C8R46DRAFT_884437 [Mycena filopes]|nr:hypothetical protein C8R46DRAFT_884437 [Mycena filopes]
MWCRGGCDVLETTHHIFVECPAFKTTRLIHKTNLVAHVRQLLEPTDLPITAEDKANLTKYTERLFCDGKAWPGGVCRYYLGVVPSIEVILGSSRARTVPRLRLVTRLANTWHTEAIRLGGRIWGQLQRRCHPEWTKRREKEIQMREELERALPLHLRARLPATAG